MLVDGAGPDTDYHSGKGKGYEAHGARHGHGVPLGDGLQLGTLAVLHLHQAFLCCADGCDKDQTIECGDEVQGCAPRDDPVAGALVAVTQLGWDDHDHLLPRVRAPQASVPAPDDLARPQGEADRLPVLVGVEHLAVRQEALVGDQHRVAIPALLRGHAVQR